MFLPKVYVWEAGVARMKSQSTAYELLLATVLLVNPYLFEFNIAFIKQLLNLLGLLACLLT